MGVLGAVLSLAFAGVLLLAPGALLVRVLRPTAGWTRTLAIAPAVSLGIIWALGTVLTLGDVPVTRLSMLLGLVVLLGSVTLLAGRSAARLRMLPQGSPGWTVDRWDVAGLATGITVALLVWCATTGWLTMAAPNDDGTHHGVFVTRILMTESVDAAQVFVDDAITPTGNRAFYPMAIHLVGALVTAPDGDVARGLNATWMLLATLGLVLGTFVLARRTLPGRRRAALAAAAFAGVLPQIPFLPLWWGGLALVATMGLVPSVVDAVLGLGDDVREARRGAPMFVGAALGLALVGVFFAHVAELLSIALLTTCLLLVGAAPISRWLAWWAGWRRTGVAAGAAALVMLAVAVPSLVGLAGLAASRSELELEDVFGVGHVISIVLYYGAGARSMWVVTGPLILLGILVGVRARIVGGWLAFAGLIVVLTVMAGLQLPGSVLLTAPWYADTGRVAYNLVYPGVVLLGLGSHAAASWVNQRLGRTSLPAPARTAIATLVPAGLVLTLLAYESAATNRGHFAGSPGDLHAGSLANPDARAAWDWLAPRVPTQGRVLNHFADGSGWMYAASGVAPVLLLKPNPPLLERGDRGYLLEHAAQVATDRRAAAAADSLGVRYAYVGNQLFPSHDASTNILLSVPDLVAGGWIVVFRSGGATVLERPSA